MRDIQIDDEGELRCASCGSRHFTEKRTTRAKLGGGGAAVLTFGVAGAAAPLLTSKKQRCQACGAYNKTGNAKPYIVAGQTSRGTPAGGNTTPTAPVATPRTGDPASTSEGGEIAGVILIVFITIGLLIWFITSGSWVAVVITGLVLAAELVGLVGIAKGLDKPNQAQPGRPATGAPRPPVDPAPPQLNVPQPPGWYPNTMGSGERYWSGTAWTSKSR